MTYNELKLSSQSHSDTKEPPSQGSIGRYCR